MPPKGDTYNNFLDNADDVTKHKEVQRLELQHRMMAGMVERWVRDAGVEGREWLDLGCGPGHDTALLCRLGGKKVVGMDINPELLEQAKESYSEEFQGVVSFQEGSASNIPLEDSSVDMVLVKLVLQHVVGEAREKVVSELFRVLKPGGKVLIVDVDDSNGSFVAPEPEGLRQALDLFMKTLQENEGSEFGANDRRVAKKLTPTLRKVGFSKVQLRTDSVVGGADEEFSVEQVFDAFYQWRFSYLFHHGKEEAMDWVKMVFSKLQRLKSDRNATVMYPLFLVQAEK